MVREGMIKMKVNDKKLKEYLKKIKAPICPLCGSNHWTVSDKIFQLHEFQNGDLIIGGDSKILPVLPLTCENCGNTYFINAIRAQLIDPNDKEVKTNADKN